jgi:hypothetical protein
MRHLPVLHHLAKGALMGREREWWAKAPAHVLRLAGTLCHLSWAMAGGPEPERVDVEFVQVAVRLVRDYFWPHARAALRQIGFSERHANARRVLGWIKAHGKNEVSRAEIRREALGRSLDADQTQSLLDSLVKAGWLRESSISTAGRKRRRWQVNPLIHATAEA